VKQNFYGEASEGSLWGFVPFQKMLEKPEIRPLYLIG
jgi:hypothetical protein